MSRHIFTGIIALFLITTSCDPKNDSVKEAHEKNLNSAIDDEISKFMTQAADAFMMNIAQGKLAVGKGTNDLIRNYGNKMAEENARILTELRTIAASKNITLPTELSNKKANALEDLNEKEGKKFDEKFMQMMAADHKRDVDEFEDATDFKDEDVRRFAMRTLPLIESHLHGIERVEYSYEKITGQ